MQNPIMKFISGVRPRMCMFKGMFQSKYIEIVLAVALFILLDTGVLIINFYTSFQIANDAHAIQLGSRMGTLSQSLLSELYQVQEDLNNSVVDYTKSVDALADSYKIFDETLDAFIYGGELIGVGQGKDVLLQGTVYRDTSSHLLKEAEGMWKEYRIKLKPIVYSYFNDLEREEILEATNIAITYSRQHSEKLLDLIQSFSVAIEDIAKRKAERLRTIQSVGISLAVLNFFLILFHFLRRLKQSDLLVEESRKETEEILENVNEGLFLLNRDFTIGNKHSESLHGLFKNDNLAGLNFIDLLGQLVSEKTLEDVEEYADLLFSPRVNESLISDLNPLDQVEINFTTDTASFDIRYFRFQFSRVYDKKKFETLLVTVKDITTEVLLAEQLKVASEKSSKEIDMLLSIIHVENAMLTDFLQITGDGLNDINLILKRPVKQNENLKDKLALIAQIVHKLKGDSTSLGLDFLIEKLHRFEQEVIKLKEKAGLTGEDFLPLVVALKQLISDFLIIGNLQQKMNSIDVSGVQLERGGFSSGCETVDKKTWDVQLMRRMTNLVERVAKDCKKKVTLDMSTFDSSLLSEDHMEPVKDILVQSLRNSIAHGIEIPALRGKSGKSQKGHIQVSLVKKDSDISLVIRDDGQGIDLDKIKETAVLKKMVTEKQLKSMTRSNLLSLIFKQGFTTINESGLHAGHGIGMNLIKTSVDKLNGQIKVRYQAGEYTEFQFIFKPEMSVI